VNKKLFLLDAMALIYRAYYAMVRSPRITSKGLNTSAIFGFCTTLYEVLQTEKPTHIAVSFDTGSPTLRHADFAAYKANRQATPEDIVISIPYIKKLLAAFRIPIIEKEGYEADDIIGTLAKHAEIEGFEVYMMTSDKDYGQLVSDHIHLYKPGKFGQKSEIVGVAQICEKYAIQNPEQLIDILGLWGDASDNIPGVPNIGEVKAKKLIAQFGSIEQIYQRIDEVENEKLRQILIDNQEQAMMSKMLATIILNVPIARNFDDMACQNPDIAKLKALFDELEFKSLGARIFAGLRLATANAPVTATAPDLFSELSVDNQYAPSISCHKSYKDFEHHYSKIEAIEDIEKIISHLLEYHTPLAIEFIKQNERFVGIMVGSSQKSYYALYEDNSDLFWSFSKEILKSDCTLLTFQCKPIYKWARKQGFTVNTPFYDLQIAHYLIQPENSHNLDRLCENELDYALINETSTNFSDIKIQQACEFIEVYHRLYLILDQKLEETGSKKLFTEIEMPLSEVLANMEYDGVFIDKKMLQEVSNTLSEEMYHIEQQVFQFAGERFNLASPKQLGDILFGKMHIIENAKLTKSKQYQTGEEVLSKLVNKHPIISLILEWRTLSKLKSTYVDALPQLIDPQTGRIHTTYTQTVTSTGRLSSLNPNLQNIPVRTERGREIRRAFATPDRQHVIMSADYSQIELRIVASICGDPCMIDSFNAGKDIHAAMAACIYKINESEVTPAMRRSAKSVNFGILYGMSAFGLSDRLHIPHKEAKDLIDNYFTNFPKISQYLTDTIELARTKGYVSTLFGRRRYIYNIDSQNGILRKSAERNAINAPIQGTAADLIKVAMLHIYKAMKAENLKSTMLMQVHDELVFEVPIDEIEVMQSIIKDNMKNAMTLSVPLEVDIAYGQSWLDAH